MKLILLLVLFTSLSLQGKAQIPDSVIVSNTNWFESTITAAPGGTSPWTGVTAVSIPPDGTFTTPAALGATVITPVSGSQEMFAGNDVRFFRYTFDLQCIDISTALFEATVDNQIQIFVNDNDIALEDDLAVENFFFPASTVLVNNAGVNVNGASGGQVFDFVTALNTGAIFVLGTNEIVVAVRNTSGGDVGGWSFKLTIEFDPILCLIALPVELLNFNAQRINDEFVKLDWQTASEINNDYFTIERSLNGIDWDEIDRIDGAGNSSSLLSYESIDKSPLMGISYYRLKQTDFDGEFSYSNIKSINFNLVNNQIEIFPNPTKNQITITGNKSELETINIYSVLGQNVTNKTIIKKLDSKVIIDLTKLSEGTYYIRTKTTANKVYKQ